MKETSNYSFPFLKVVLASVLSFFLFSLSFSFLYTYNSCFSTLALAGRPLFLVIGLAFET